MSDIANIPTKRYCPCCAMNKNAYTMWTKDAHGNEVCENDPQLHGVGQPVCEDEDCSYECFHDEHPLYVRNGSYTLFPCEMSDEECCGGMCPNGDLRMIMLEAMKNEAEAGRFDHKLWSLAFPKESATIAKQIEEKSMCATM
jgi:hypothetical protein